MASAMAVIISSVGCHLFLSKYRFLANLCRVSMTRLSRRSIEEKSSISKAELSSLSCAGSLNRPSSSKSK
jgi:hypothetical protein